jgi:mono/diheme cytochrome c family protein
MVRRRLSAVGRFVAFVSFVVPFSTADEKVLVAPNHAPQMKEGLALFKNRVGSILKTHCLACHGGEAIKGDFDLSSREKLLASGYVELAKAAESHFIAVIKHESDPFMPKDAEKLKRDDIEAIAKWIDLGAPYDQPLVDSDVRDAGVSPFTDEERNFWSFRPLLPQVPPEANHPWIKTPIDQFVLEKLNSKGIKPNPMTDRRHLIRRAYFDLTGIPPSPDEVEAFVKSTDSDAYSKLIDKLLQSPQYGERWARHWMDLARFGESHGYEQDTDRLTAYHYRDFLIKALNADIPYDRFVRWQIAGDELEPENPLALMATGFLGAGVFPTQLTEKEFESSRYDELDDIVSTLGTTVLGLSIGCARCHAHKFDPIPALDYYRMAANFTTTIRSEVELDLEPEINQQRQAEYERQLAKATESLQAYEATELPSVSNELLNRFKSDSSAIDAWDDFKSADITSPKKKFTLQSDRSWLVTDVADTKDTVTFVGVPGSSPIQSLRLEALRDKKLPKGGAGRAKDGHLFIGELKVRIIGNDKKLRKISPIANGLVSNETATANDLIQRLSDNDRATGWEVVAKDMASDQSLVLHFTKPLELGEGEKLQVEIVPGTAEDTGSVGRFRISTTNRSNLLPVIGSSGLNVDIRKALAQLTEKFDRGSKEFKVAKDWIAERIPQYRQLIERLQKLDEKKTGIILTKVQINTEGMPRMPHLADGRGFPHFYPDTYFLNRGDVSQKRDKVDAGFLRVLMRNDRQQKDWEIAKPEGWDRTSYRRTSLANWLTDPQDGAGHLAARVIVNRLWQHHFGVGIVPTASDFGKQGDQPTHAELLDWLAVDLIQNGWKLKRMHRLMMTSSVYMQSSDVSGTKNGEGRLKADRENQLFWRFNPRRLEAEAIRDSLLAVSGQLDTTMFGPGTLDPNMKRRSIYFQIKRSQLIPMMVLFDWPEHQVSIGTRSRTTIAPQALAFMNSPQCRVYAQALADRVRSDSAEASIHNTYRQVLGRKPKDTELKLALAFLEKQASEYAANQLEKGRERALVDLCQTVLSMNEFVYVE